MPRFGKDRSLRVLNFLFVGGHFKEEPVFQKRKVSDDTGCLRGPVASVGRTGTVRPEYGDGVGRMRGPDR